MNLFTGLRSLLLMIVTIFVMQAEATSQTIQLGISASGQNLVVSAKPSADFDGGLSGFAITLRWLNSYNINLGAVSSSFPIVKSRDEIVSGGFESQMFVLSAPVQPLHWTAGTIYQLFSVPLSQLGAGAGTFELAPAGFKSNGEGNPYVEFNLLNVTNNAEPFYAPSADLALPIQLGIATSGQNLVVSAKPSADFDGGLSGFAVTIRWSDSYNINLGTISSTFPIVKSKDELVSGGYESQMFVLSAPVQPLHWAAGTIYPLFSISLSQLGIGVGKFELAPAGFKANGEGDPYVEFNLYNVTNNTEPFYAQSTELALPVELTSFVAKPDRQGVMLVWNTATENNNAGFEVQRAAARKDMKVWEAVGFVEGSGTSNAPKDYAFRNRDIQTGKYVYRLKQVDRDGNFSYSNEVEAEVGAPDEFMMSQNFPNPFNPTTAINFTLKDRSAVTVQIYDLAGREVRTIMQEEKDAGYYTVNVDASALSSGIYLYRLTAVSKSQMYTSMKKMLLLK